MLTISIGWFKSREAAPHVVNNLLTFALVPPGQRTCLRRRGARATCRFRRSVLLPTRLCSVSHRAGWRLRWHRRLPECPLERTSFVQKTREALMPILSGRALLGDPDDGGRLRRCAARHHVGLVLFALVLVVFQHLVGELLLFFSAASKALHRVATIDDLTGLANREHSRGKVDEEANSCKVSRQAVLRDPDGPGSVQGGQRHARPRLRRSCCSRGWVPGLTMRAWGPSGMVARLGGDEFAFFSGLYTDDHEQLQKFADRLLELAPSGDRGRRTLARARCQRGHRHVPAGRRGRPHTATQGRSGHVRGQDRSDWVRLLQP